MFLWARGSTKAERSCVKRTKASAHFERCVLDLPGAKKHTRQRPPRFRVLLVGQSEYKDLLQDHNLVIQFSSCYQGMQRYEIALDFDKTSVIRDERINTMKS